MNTVTFGTKNSYTDFGLILTDKEITLPEPKIEEVEVLGMDGTIDLTEFLSDDIKYTKGKMQFTFTLIDDNNQGWSTTLSAFSNYIHGKKLRLLLSWDKSYYYEGRCKVNKFKTNKKLSSIVVDAELDPYKSEVNGMGTPWIWDTFSFKNGIIYVNEFNVNGSETINLLNRRKIVSPEFTCSVPMKVEYKGRIYNLPAGTTKVLDIRLVEGDNFVTITGTGTVSINYKGGSL